MKQSRNPSSVGNSQPTTARWVAVALPLLTVVACFLGGATQRWSQAIVLGGFALLLLVAPPRFSLRPLLNTIAVLFVALACVAFLPARYFFLPSWRVALTNDVGLNLPSTVSLQPWLSLDCLIVLIAGLAWIYYVTTLDLNSRDVRLAARLLAAGMIALAGLSVFLFLTHHALPFWHSPLGFGPFPNRNQTGDLFGISTVLVLGCMQDDFRRGHKRWILWLVGFAILVAALIYDFSRAGILILIIGCVAWLGRLAFRKWSGAGVAIAVSLLCLLLATLLVFGGETIERFHLRLGTEGAVDSDYRWLIFRDAWTMIRSSPWCGVGLGNFEGAFALFREASQRVSRSLHPESDWLWVWAEMGWPAVALLLAAGGILFWRVLPLKEGTNQRVRFTAAAGAFLFALHGCVDVSAHRLGTFLAGTLLLGLAQFCPGPAGSQKRWPAFVFRIVGLLLAIVCGCWFFGLRNALPVPGYVGVQNAKAAAVLANRGHRFEQAIALTDRALEWAPLDWEIYFLRAAAHIGRRDPPIRAVEDFRRARFLEPNSPQLPFEEGKVWLGWQPTLAITAWREALQRRGATEAGLYVKMLAEAKERDATVYDSLRDCAIGRPDFMLSYLEDANESQFTTALGELFRDDPTLSQFTPGQTERFFMLWARRDRLSDINQAVAARPEWLRFAWREVARYHASQNDFAEAWRIVKRYATPPVLPAEAVGVSIPQLEQKVYANPGGVADGYALYRAQLAAGRTDDALTTARHFTERAGAPAYFHFLEADAWAAKQNWERAWQSWERYHRATEGR